MKYILYIVIFAFSLLGAGEAIGQQFQRPSSFTHNNAFWNPAFIGLEKTLSANAYISQQWLAFGGNAPRNIALDFQYPFVDMNMAVAGGIISDKTGPVSKNGVNISYAYHLNNIGRNDGQITMAVMAEGQRYSIDASSEIVRDGADPLVITSAQSSFLPKLGAGFLYISDINKYNYNTSFYAGLSGFQLLENNLLLSDKINVKRIRGINMDIGVKMYRYKAMIHPSISFSYTSPDIVYAVGNVSYELKDLCWFGAGYSSAREIHVQGGYIIDRVNGRDTRLKLGLIAGIPTALNRFTVLGPSAELFVRYEMDYD